MGGMGNQMFQYVMAKSLSRKYNVEFKLDRTYLDHVDWRNYDLDLFNFEVDFIGGGISAVPVQETTLLFDSSIYNIYDTLPKENNIYLVGYWQHRDYVYPIDSEIRKDFTLRNPIVDPKILDLLEDIKSSNSVMLNVRRADFVDNAFHGTMDTNYYDKAERKIRDKVETPRFFIFSDDVEWCKYNLKIENSFFVDHSYKGDRFGAYLELMKTCKHFIIPNSSFGWWAAYLSDNPDKVVIAPERWFLDTNTKIDIINDKLGWIKL